MPESISQPQLYRRRSVPTELNEWTVTELKEGLYEIQKRLPSDDRDAAIAAFTQELDDRNKKG